MFTGRIFFLVFLQSFFVATQSAHAALDHSQVVFVGGDEEAGLAPVDDDSGFDLPPLPAPLRDDEAGPGKAKKRFRHTRQDDKDHARVMIPEQAIITVEGVYMTLRTLNGTLLAPYIKRVDKGYECVDCGQWSKTHYGMLEHLIANSDFHRTYCKLCGDDLSQIKDLEAHATTEQHTALLAAAGITLEMFLRELMVKRDELKNLAKSIRR